MGLLYLFIILVTTLNGMAHIEKKVEVSASVALILLLDLSFSPLHSLSVTSTLTLPSHLHADMFLNVFLVSDLPNSRC
jgi:hypothetical protein